MFHCALFDMTLWVIVSKRLFELLYSALAPFGYIALSILPRQRNGCIVKQRMVQATHGAFHALKEILRYIEKINISGVFKHTKKLKKLFKKNCAILFLSHLPT